MSIVSKRVIKKSSQHTVMKAQFFLYPRKDEMNMQPYDERVMRTEKGEVEEKQEMEASFIISFHFVTGLLTEA